MYITDTPPPPGDFAPLQRKSKSLDAEERELHEAKDKLRRAQELAALQAQEAAGAHQLTVIAPIAQECCLVLLFVTGWSWKRR